MVAVCLKELLFKTYFPNHLQNLSEFSLYAIIIVLGKTAIPWMVPCTNPHWQIYYEYTLLWEEINDS